MKIVVLFFFLFINQICFSQDGFVVDHRHTDISQIPDEFITAAKQKLKIRYFRRSHGSQLDVGGMAALRRYSTAYDTKFAYNATGASNELLFSTLWNSLDFENATWVSTTTSFLNDPANSEINVLMWAWSSRFYESDAQAYIDDMEALIAKYGPGGSLNRSVPVTFIFQTACGQRSASRNKKVFDGNNLIRNHCNTKNRILFDFNDLECYDPDGNYFGDGNTGGSYTSERMLNDDLAYISSSPGGSVYSNCRNWGIDWMNDNPTSELTKLSADDVCTVCEHSMGTYEGETKDNSRLHCVLKGRAAWWMWAVLGGWNAGLTPTVVNKIDEVKTYQLKNYPNPFNNNTIIQYQLKENSRVKLEIWNSSGQRIKVLLYKNQSKGSHQIPVQLDNKNGIYFYTLEVNGQRIARKMIKH